MQDVRYGQIKGGEIGFPFPFAISQTIPAASGRFVKRTGASTDSATLALAGTTELIGWIEIEPIPNSVNIATSLGTEVRKVINDLTAIFRIPINSGTYVDLMKGKTCDISISGTVQGAALDTSTEDTLVIADGDLEDNKWVDVKLNPLKMYATGVV